MAKTQDEKPAYQAPVVMDLGELARGSGDNCSPGSGATGTGLGLCYSGLVAQGQCGSGGSR